VYSSSLLVLLVMDFSRLSVEQIKLRLEYETSSYYYLYINLYLTTELVAQTRHIDLYHKIVIVDLGEEI
jgi:hypothetical protein